MVGPEYRHFIVLGNFCESEAFFLVSGHEIGGDGGQSLFAPSLPTGESLPVEDDMESTRSILSLQTISLSVYPSCDLKY